MTDDKIRVMIAEDHEMVRSGLKSLLEEDSTIQVVAEASNGKEAITKYESYLPDVLLLDISMPDMDGLDASKEILGNHPDARILAVTMHDETKYAARLLRTGVLGYITKKADPEALQDAVHAVYIRKTYLTEEAKDNLLQQMVHLQDNRNVIERLSDREIQVLTLIARGKKPKEIGENLGICVKTVDNYRSHILQKLDIKSNAELVLFARDQGLV